MENTKLECHFWTQCSAVRISLRVTMFFFFLFSNFISYLLIASTEPNLWGWTKLCCLHQCLRVSTHLRAHIIVITFAKRSQRENTLLIAMGAVGKLMGRWRRLRRKHIEDDMAVKKSSHSFSTFGFAIISHSICRKLKSYTPCYKYGHETPSDILPEDISQ